MYKQANKFSALLRQSGKSLGARLPTAEVGNGWLPYLLNGTGTAAGSAFKGLRGLSNLQRGAAPAALVGGGAAGADLLADGELNHGGAAALLAGLAGAVPGARNAAGLVGRRMRGNLGLVRKLELAGIRPAQASTDAMTAIAQRIGGLSGDRMPLRPALSSAFSTGDELRIGLLSNSKQTASVSRKAMTDAPKRWGIKTMDAGDVQNPDIFSGLMEDKMLLRRSLSRMGYSKLKGHAAHSATREARPMLMDALYAHAANATKGKRFRAGQTAGAMPDYDDAAEWFARKGIIGQTPDEIYSMSERRAGKIRDGVMDAFKIRDMDDWNHASDRALASASETFGRVDPALLRYGRNKLPVARDPSLVLPQTPSLSKWFDTRTGRSDFNIDLKQWAAQQAAAKVPQPLAKAARASYQLLGV